MNSLDNATAAPRVLVCGGGIGGNAVALQLVRAGIRPTVVERAAAPAPAVRPSTCADRVATSRTGWA